MPTSEKRIKRRVRSAYLVSTVSIALVLFMLGAVGYLILNARKASRDLREDITLSVLLKDDITPSEVNSLQARLKTLPEVKEIDYVSKEAAAEDFKAYWGNDFVVFLDENPLPASIELTLRAEFSKSEDIERLDAEISGWDNVDEIIYQETVIRQITDNIARFNLLMLIFGGLLLLISLILINNTIRMAIFSKRLVINTMKLVGATRGFILRPFIWTAVKQGLSAAFISYILIGAVVYGLSTGIPEAGFIRDVEPLLILCGAILVLGVVISILFTYGAVSKYVRLNSGQIHTY